MSTALVSAFYDVGDVIFQNRKNLLAQQRAVTTVTERRIMGQATFANRMVSSPDANALLQQTTCTRKLDRSMSEPVDRVMLSKTQALSQAPVNSSRYKTELCRPFEENGHCKYGDKCQFAHGAHELRSLSRHPKYKTELCRTFHTIGFCPYGPRCHFIHNEDLRRLTQISQRSQQQAMSPPTYATSPPTSISRPKALSFDMLRDSLGSTADSPPSSTTGSPTMSPTMLDDFVGLQMGSMPSAFSPPASAPASMHGNAFTFPTHEDLLMPPSAPMLAPLNVQTDTAAILGLSASLGGLSMSAPTCDRDALDSLYAHPSSPDSDSGDSGVSSNGSSSTCGSPLDVSRNLRLPIFSKLSSRE